MSIPRTDAKRVTHIDYESLDRGRVHNLLLDLVEDALGQPTHIPVIVARGRREGPILGLTAAVHGNELNGIPVIHEVIRQLDLNQLRGTLVAALVVNVPGFRLHQREMDQGTDLNTAFPGRARGNEPQTYAHRVLHRLIKPMDRLVDLHTASFGRINSLYARADMDDPIARRMAYLLRPQLILHNQASDRTLRGNAMRLGTPAVTLEVGDPQRFQPQFIRSSVLGVRRIMGDARMLPKRKVALGPEPVLCERSRWNYTGRGGLLRVHPKLLDEVKKGEVIATLVDVFGKEVAEYNAQEDGVVIGKSVNPAGATGARIAHIGRIAPPERFVARDA
ncbi:MAG: succinylglutamate desuccinylase/aspartoacylase family protein [Polyangiales bacterium]